MKLSKKERNVISEGLLALLDNIHKAKCLIHDQKTTKAMDEYEKRVMELNQRICLNNN